MEELIPMTDFDQRYYPEISEEEKVNFILHSNSFERINLKIEQIQANLLIPSRADPAVAGQMRCLHLIFDLAKNPNLIPKPELINTSNFDKHFPWLKQLHKNLLHDFSRKGTELLNQIDYPTPEELGNYRTEHKSLGHRIMPPPEQIKILLTKIFTNYAHIYYQYKEQIETPILMEKTDWETLEQIIQHTSLSIACIKPFKEGSNRIARLIENLLRLNIGLKFIVHTNKDTYLQKLLSLQDNNYKITQTVEE
jgi:fido (protein-threonine AMPylation protein)